MPSRRTKPNHLRQPSRSRRAPRANGHETDPKLSAATMIPPSLADMGCSVEVAVADAMPVDEVSVWIYCPLGLSIGAAPYLGVDKPYWNAAIRRLDFCEASAKPLRCDATNLLAALDAFQREGWPERIADPLPRGEVDVRDRLYNTVKRLNRHFTGMIRFSCDGHGTGIFWRAASGHR